MIEALLVFVGSLMILAQIAIPLIILGCVIWFLVEFASIIFKLFAYGFLTILALGGLVWLFV